MRRLCHLFWALLFLTGIWGSSAPAEVVPVTPVRANPGQTTASEGNQPSGVTSVAERRSDVARPPGSLTAEQLATEWKRFTFEPEDDRDYDRQPDGWSRRQGPEFPPYIPMEIDRTFGCESRQSLKCDLAGGAVAYYSPLLRVDDEHSYVVRGKILTKGLVHDAALISVSVLNHKRERTQRFLSSPVGGTHREWVELTLPTIAPADDARFLVVGVHLVHGSKMDVRGQVWFDELWIGRLPRMTLLSNAQQHLFAVGALVQIENHVQGIEAGVEHQLQMTLSNQYGEKLQEQVVSISRASDDAPSPVQKWQLGQLQPGFYAIHALVRLNGVVILEQNRTFAVMEPLGSNLRGEFGWSLSSGTGDVPPEQLYPTLTQAGLRWVKLPLWSTADARMESKAIAYGKLIERLERSGITTVGLLNDPPESLLHKFANHIDSVSQLYSLPPEVWYQSLEPVIARYSFHVRHWQLGQEEDNSFQQMNDIAPVLMRVKHELDRIGHDVHLGLHWDWGRPLPSTTGLPPLFVSWHSKQIVTPEELRVKLAEPGTDKIPRWFWLRAKPVNHGSVPERATDLVLRMVAAKAGGAEAIFAADPFHPQEGLLYPDGSPNEMFLPWRNAAATLARTTYAGELVLENGSRNAVFVDPPYAAIYLWNPEPVEERMRLGESDVQMFDLWGRQLTLPTDPDGTQTVSVGPVPILIRKASEPLMQFQLALQYQHGAIKSEYGAHREAILGYNPFPQGMNGTVKVYFPKDWKLDPEAWQLQLAAGEKFELPFELRFPPNSRLGEFPTRLDIELSAQRLYKFSLYRPYRLGTGDVLLDVVERWLPDGRLELEQRITNNTDEQLNFQCSLIIPGLRRQRYTASKIGRGIDYRIYHVRDAASFRGQEFRLRVEQIDGRRILNYTWRVGDRVEPEKEPVEENPAKAAGRFPDAEAE